MGQTGKNILPNRNKYFSELVDKLNYPIYAFYEGKIMNINLRQDMIKLIALM